MNESIDSFRTQVDNTRNWWSQCFRILFCTLSAASWNGFKMEINSLMMLMFREERFLCSLKAPNCCSNIGVLFLTSETRITADSAMFDCALLIAQARHFWLSDSNKGFVIGYQCVQTWGFLLYLIRSTQDFFNIFVSVSRTRPSKKREEWNENCSCKFLIGNKLSKFHSIKTLKFLITRPSFGYILL